MRCDNRWGLYCHCVKTRGHRKPCVCPHGIDFPVLCDDKEALREVKQNMTYQQEITAATEDN